MKKMVLSLIALAMLASLKGSMALAEDLDWISCYSQEASSVLESAEYSYAPWKILDGDLSTAWVEGAKGDGIGESIILRSAPFSKIREMVIWPGYYKSPDLYEKNSVPTLVRVSSGGSSADFDLTEYGLGYAENMEGLSVPFPEDFVTDGKMKLSILAARSGSLYQDTCISEVQFYGEAGDEVLFREAGILTWIYLNRNDAWNLNNCVSETIRRADLAPDDLANGIFWYQYHMDDPRIFGGDLEMNTLSEDLVRSIMTELFGREDEEALLILGASYGSFEDGTYKLPSTGDYGDAPCVYCSPDTFARDRDYCTVRGDMKNSRGETLGHFEGRFSSGSAESGVHRFEDLTVEFY